MLSDYLGEPQYVKGIGNIYPIKILEYDKFRKMAVKYILTSKRTMELLNGEKIDKELLEILVIRIMQFELTKNELLMKMLSNDEREIFNQLKNVNEENKLSIKEFIKLLEMTLHCEVIFDEESITFRINNSNTERNELNKDNFEQYREIVMRQNLLYEPLYFADPILQRFLENYREISAHEDNDTSIEGMLQIVSLKKGMLPKQFIDYTYYQLVADYSRIQLSESYEWVKLQQTSGFASKQINPPNIAKDINLNENPEEKGFIKVNAYNDGVDSQLSTTINS